MEKKQQIWSKIESLVEEFNELRLSELIDYQKFYLYSVISHSTAIEGSTLTEAETQILFEDGLTANGKSLVHHLMNEDLKNAYYFAFEKARQNAPITPSFLNEISALVIRSTGNIYNSISGQFDSSKGDYRLHGVTPVLVASRM